MDSKGYYSILGLSENATSDQIKIAYRNLALKYHPDRNKSATASDTMKRINEAYEVLLDPESRREYTCELKTNSSTSSAEPKPPWWYTWFGDFDEDYESDYQREWRFSHGQYTSYTYSTASKRDYKDKRVGIIGQMIGSLIPLINFWIFGRIERLEMAFSCLFPILIGLIVLMTTLPEYPYFLLTYQDRLYLFIILFGAALVFFARKWSLQWNEQIDNGKIPSGDEIDKKVSLVTQMILSMIPFLNFTAFARIYHFIRAAVIGIPTYIIMAFVSKWMAYDNPYLFYTIYLTLTATVFMCFMYRWTTKYNSENYRKWNESWKDL